MALSSAIEEGGCLLNSHSDDWDGLSEKRTNWRNMESLSQSQLSQQPCAEVDSSLHVPDATRDDFLSLIGIKIQLFPLNPPEDNCRKASLL